MQRVVELWRVQRSRFKEKENESAILGAAILKALKRVALMLAWQRNHGNHAVAHHVRNGLAGGEMGSASAPAPGRWQYRRHREASTENIISFPPWKLFGWRQEMKSPVQMDRK